MRPNYESALSAGTFCNEFIAHAYGPLEQLRLSCAAAILADLSTVLHRYSQSRGSILSIHRESAATRPRRGRDDQEGIWHSKQSQLATL